MDQCQPLTHWDLVTHIDGLAQDYSDPIADALELLQPSIYASVNRVLVGAGNGLVRNGHHNHSSTLNH